MTFPCLGGQGARPLAGSRGSAPGFTLIEVVISIAILMALTIAVAQMMRSGFDIKAGLSERARVVHRLSTAMGKMADDVQHAFLVSAKDQVRNGIDRNMKTMFKLEKSGTGGDKLSLTTTTHKPNKAGAYESEFTFVVYELKDSKEQPGRKDLFRAETPAVPLDLKEAPSERLLARNIKSLTVECWNGDTWSKDRWDTGSSDTRNILPHMVKITIEAWDHEHPQGDTSSDESTDGATDKLSTVVLLANAQDFPEMKEGSKTVHWDNL